MKDLLVEYIPFNISPSMIQESISINGKILVSGVLQRAGAKNQNGRVYPKDVLQREAEKYNQEFVAQNRALGELDHPECLTSSAELMTTDGWKYLKDLSGSEKVFTLNRFTNEIEVKSINKVINEPYKGKMVVIKGKNINTTVTPNHKFIVTDRNGVNTFITAQEILDLSKKIKVSHLAIPKTGIWRKDAYEDSFTIDPVETNKRSSKKRSEEQSKPLVLNTKAFFAFLGFYFAEGGVDKSGRSNSITFTQNKGEVLDEFKSILKELSDELHWKEYPKSLKSVMLKVSDQRLHTFLKDFGNVYTKRIPEFIKDSHPELLDIFLEWYIKGDGTIVRSNGYDRCSVFTVSKGMIEDLNEILIKVGSSGVIKEQVSKKDYNFAGRVIQHKNKKTLYRLWFEKSKYIHLDFRFIDVEEVDYEGNVYCINTDNETFYCRDNKKSFWSGNSSVVNLANASHNVIKMWWEGDDLMGKVEVLPTPSGNILKSLLESGVTLGISSRGVGSVKEVFTEDRQKYLQVQEDFELVCFDFVSNPSTHGAFMNPVRESVGDANNKTAKINKLITDIICDIGEYCPCN
jgi:hypothetical protein